MAARNATACNLLAYHGLCLGDRVQGEGVHTGAQHGHPVPVRAQPLPISRAAHSHAKSAHLLRTEQPPHAHMALPLELQQLPTPQLRLFTSANRALLLLNPHNTPLPSHRNPPPSPPPSTTTAHNSHNATARLVKQTRRHRAIANHSHLHAEQQSETHHRHDCNLICNNLDIYSRKCEENREKVWWRLMM
jgi:hypothetical protein